MRQSTDCHRIDGPQDHCQGTKSGVELLSLGYLTVLKLRKLEQTREASAGLFRAGSPNSSTWGPSEPLLVAREEKLLCGCTGKETPNPKHKGCLGARGSALAGSWQG